MKTWKTLPADKRMVYALDRCEPRPSDDDAQVPKKLWSKQFADACAVMLAEELRRSKVLKAHHILPDKDGNRTEFVTAAGRRGKGKKVDVSVSTLSAGLQLAMTLKGGNFRDPGDGGYGKNLTGRLYELIDETRAVHEYHPHSPIVCVYYFPIGASTDRAKKSTLARAVATLRARTGRDDPLLPSQFGRFDWSVIGLYEPTGSGVIDRGVVRYFDVLEAPPVVGRPRVDTTMSTDEFVRRVVDIFDGKGAQEIDYVDPEPD